MIWDIDFYPTALERGRHSERALALALCQMYVQGVSTRKTQQILEQMCGLRVSSQQLSRACQQLDPALKAWRTRKLGKYPYVYLDARYEKVRQNHCLIPLRNGVIKKAQYGNLERKELWGNDYMHAPSQQRQCVEKYKRVKRVYTS